jgi:ABC-type lipoprotein export system ATPase subunit
MSAPVLYIANVSKNYSALRPLRIQELAVGQGEVVAVSGFDAAAAELLVNLVTGASLPDQGTVTTFGRPTAEIADGEAWLSSLERFGIVSERAVMLEGATLLQNLALPLTLEIDPVPPSVIQQVQGLARECGIAIEALSIRAGELPPHVRVRAHLARAVALNPSFLLIEHPTAAVGERERVPLARDMAAVAGKRRVSALVMTLDAEFAEVVAHRSLALQPATGAMVVWKPKRGWFR